jgi:hypothetical protein
MVRRHVIYLYLLGCNLSINIDFVYEYAKVLAFLVAIMYTIIYKSTK